MSKGILIIDGFPESCVDCNFFTDEDGTINFKCSLTGRTNLATLHERFPDCPLKKLPEKIDQDQDDFKSGFWYQVSLGWNLCLDEILGTED